MAKVKRVKRYIVYLSAFLISSIFTFFGRTTPGWAEEVQDTFMLNQNRTFYQPDQTQLFVTNPNLIVGRQNSPDRPVFTNMGQSYSEQAVDRINEDAAIITRIIEGKIEQNLQLTPAEFAALEAIDSSIQIDELKNQINVLTTLIQNLQNEIQTLQQGN